MAPEGQNDLAYRPSDRESQRQQPSVFQWLYSFVDEPEEIARLIMLLVAVVLIIAGFRYSDREVVKTYFDDFNANIGTEIISILITVFVLDRLQSRRAEKNTLILQMGSPNNTVSIEAVRQLRAKGWLKDGSLSMAELRGANLHGAKLREANLRGANLLMADLGESYLRRANLREANLREADLSETNLRWADLHRAKLFMANLSEADLNSADLRKTDLREANLHSANLSEADLNSADLRKTDLHETNLHSANLFHAKYNHSTRWPDGFDPIAAGAILVDDNGDPIPPTTNQ